MSDPCDPFHDEWGNLMMDGIPTPREWRRQRRQSVAKLCAKTESHIEERFDRLSYILVQQGRWTEPARPLRGFVTKVALVNIFNGTLPELTEQPSDGDYEESDFFGSVWIRVLDTINRKLTKDHKVVLASGHDRDAPWVDAMGYGHGPFYGHYSPYMGPVNELYDLP